MKNFITFFLVFFNSLAVFGQSPCQISEHYSDLFAISKNEAYPPTSYSKTILTVNEVTCYSELVNENKLFFSYLVNNFAPRVNYPVMQVTSDSVVRNNLFIESIKADSLFSAVMNELAVKSIDHSQPKDTITLDQMLDAAVKFFSLNRINKEGYYSYNICVGLNLVAKTEKVRKPFVEAFCFDAIFRNFRAEKYKIKEDFENAIRELYTLNLGVETNDQLLRAQGAIFITMRHSEALKQLLIDEFKSKKEYMPFVLKLKK